MSGSSTDNPQNTPCENRVATLSSKIQGVYKLVEALTNKSNKTSITKILNEINNVSALINDLKINTNDNSKDNNSIILEKLNSIEKKLDNPTSRQTKVMKPKHKAIFIKPKDAESNAVEIGTKVKQVIKDCREINCENIIINNQGTRIIVESDATVTKIEHVLNNNEIGNLVNIEPLKQLLPQVSCVVTQDQIEEVDIIKRRNKIPEDLDFNIIVNREISTRSKFKRNYLIIRMSRVARDIIEKRGKLYFGCEAVTFRNNYNVRICSKCHRIGHTEKYCTNEATCGKCHADHQTKECTETSNLKHECLLCKQTGQPNIVHKPKSHLCTSYQQAIERIQRITDYDFTESYSQKLPENENQNTRNRAASQAQSRTIPPIS